VGSIWLRDLDAVLGRVPNLSTFPGWQNRSRSSGGYDGLFGIVIHHTASNTSPERDMNYMWKTAPDGPIGAIYLGRDGRIVIGAAGATNCVGKGGPLTTSKGTVPKDRGNQNTLSIEAANAGTGEAWPQVQTDAYVTLVRALCDGYGFDPNRDVYGHFDYCAPSCPGRKIDPAGPSPFGSVNASGTWNINLFRSAVTGSTPPKPPDPTPPTSGVFTVNGYRKDVRQGSEGKMAKMCQQQINLIAGQGIVEDGKFGNQSVAALKNVQAVLGVPVDGWCGQQTWQAMENGIKSQAEAGGWG